MTIWYIHRNSDGSIASAHQDHMPGYNDEQLDDAANAEIQAYRTLATRAPTASLSVDIIAAALTTKGVLTQGDIATAITAAGNKKGG